MRRALLVVLVACGSNNAAKPDAYDPDAMLDAFIPGFDAPPGPDAAPPAEVCTDGFDNDRDGNVDCADTDCSATSHCTPAAHTIQEVQDGTVVTGTRVIVSKVFVTAVRVAPSGAVLGFVQEPDGVTSGGHTYPQYAGVQIFASATDATTFPGLAALQVGDCVSLTATVIEFQGDTELLSPTAFTAETGGTCGIAPTPFAASFDAIATDTDSTTMGDQPGASAEIYEGVLVTATGLTALTAPDAASQLLVDETAGTGSALLVGNFMYVPGIAATPGQTFTSITGVYAEHSSRYQLMPRSAADAQ